MCMRAFMCVCVYIYIYIYIYNIRTNDFTRIHMAAFRDLSQNNKNTSDKGESVVKWILHKIK